jgi:hypothetical protein
MTSCARLRAGRGASCGSAASKGAGCIGFAQRKQVAVVGLFLNVSYTLK